MTIPITDHGGQVLGYGGRVLDLAEPEPVPPLMPVHRSRSQPDISIILKERATRRKDLTCRNCKPRLEVIGVLMEITHQPRCRTWADMLSRMGVR